MWNSRRASEINAIGTSTMSSPLAAGDDNADMTQPDDRMVPTIATSDRGDSRSRAVIEALDTGDRTMGKKKSLATSFVRYLLWS